ncbi:MAG: MFS transporter [Chloroflexota bacterium]
MTNQPSKMRLRDLPLNVWAVSITSFLTDISSEMVINILPLFLSNVLGIKTNVIGIIEGTAEATASLLKLFSGWLSDKLRQRKWLAVLGYGISALSKPFFFFADNWVLVGLVRWSDRVGKGIRTAPRDALVADAIDEHHRGFAFGFHRAADTAGAMIGLIVALVVIWIAQSGNLKLSRPTFQTVVLISLVPAFLAVISLIMIAKDVPVLKQRPMPKFGFKGLGKPFIVFLSIVSIFVMGNSSDAFLVLRAQERGLNVIGILGMLITFNLIYTLTSTPLGALSDRIGRRKIIAWGWVFYAIVYLGFGLAQTAWQIWGLYSLYGLYYGLTYGTMNAMIADIVPAELRGTAYGTYNAVIGILTFPASIIAGILWEGVGSWHGLGAPAPFIFGGTLAFAAAMAMMIWKPEEFRVKG